MVFCFSAKWSLNFNFIKEVKFRSCWLCYRTMPFNREIIVFSLHILKWDLEHCCGFNIVAAAPDLSQGWLNQLQLWWPTDLVHKLTTTDPWSRTSLEHSLVQCPIHNHQSCTQSSILYTVIVPHTSLQYITKEAAFSYILMILSAAFSRKCIFVVLLFSPIWPLWAELV